MMIRIYLQLILAQLLWAGAFVAGQLALDTQSPLVIALLRNSLVTLGFWIIILIKKETLVFPSWRCCKDLFWMGFLGIFVYTLLVYYGLKQSTAVSASLLIPTIQTLFTLYFAKLIHKESFNVAQIIGLLLGLVGTLAVLTGSFSLHPTEKSMLGNLLLIGGAILFSLYSTIGKNVLKELNPLLTVTYSMTIGTGMMLIFPLMHWQSFTAIPPFTMQESVSLIYLVLFAGILPYLFWYNGVKTIGVGKTGVITFLLPPFALLLSVIILHQTISILQMLGGIVGLLGVALTMGLAVKNDTRQLDVSN